MYRKLPKLILDIFVGIVLSVLTFPIIFVLMILIKVESRGPAVFKQKRIGRGSREFTIYKLRSMFYEPQSKKSFSTADNDPRITKMGRLIRKTSLDELPQFWNLAIGDMSLIGPRPNVPAQINLYTESEWALRNSIRPGITGLSQATYRSLATERIRKKLDLFYVEHVNLYLDLLVIYRTLKTLFKKGAQN